MGHDFPVGRQVAIVHGDEQRRLEPAAVLVVALEIDVRGPGQARLAAEHCGVGHARLEPDVHDVLVDDEVVSALALGTDDTLGYQTREAIDFAKEWLDGINVDLKAFNEDYYKRLCTAKLQPVLDTIEYIAKETDIWLEITTLLVPGENDSGDELTRLADFIVSKAGADVPWHISRFHPQYKYLDSWPTPIESLQRAEQIGKSAGMHYVYLGNVPGSKSESTFCYNCSQMLIERIGYRIVNNNVVDSKCPHCGTNIAGFEL